MLSPGAGSATGAVRISPSLSATGSQSGGEPNVAGAPQGRGKRKSKKRGGYYRSMAAKMNWR